MDSRQTILLLTALTGEVGGISKTILLKQPLNQKNPRRETGLDDWRIVWQLIGMKAVGLAKTDVPANCRLAILAGLSGGLDPTLEIGNVIVAGAPDWLGIPEGVQRHEIVTTDRAITSVAAKADLYAKTQAAAVDMETSIVREWAKYKSIEFVAIRAISDTAADAIDPRVMNLVDAYGRARPTHVGSYLLGNPLRMRQLIKLGANSKRAAENLGRTVREVIELLPDSKSLRDRVS